MALHEIFTQGYEIIQKDYAEEQKQFINIIAEARQMNPDFIRDSSGIFIPNNDFMIEVFGKGILEFDCYRDGLCTWDNALIFPIKDVNDCVVGFAGFFPFDYVSEEKGNYYAYSSQSVMQKGRFLFFPQGSLGKALDDKYLMIVDGIFDAISLCGYGFNAAALMGSNLTQEIIMQLRFVDNIIVIADNDSAGYRLYEKLRQKHRGTLLFKQKYTKDIDELLKSDRADSTVRELRELVQSLD